jgi:hypothetical protein
MSPGLALAISVFIQSYPTISQSIAPFLLRFFFEPMGEALSTDPLPLRSVAHDSTNQSVGRLVVPLALGGKLIPFKSKLVKSLVDTGASESIISLKAAKGLPLSSKTETKKWSTAAGLLNTSVKTKRLEFSVSLNFKLIVKSKKVISRRRHRPKELRNDNRSRPNL